MRRRVPLEPGSRPRGTTRCRSAPVLAALLIAAGLITSVGHAAEPAELQGELSVAGLPSAADAVVWLEPLGATSAAPPASGRAIIDQKGLDFDPRILVIEVGTLVEFRNSDTVLHNIFAPGLGGESFDLGTWPSGRSRTRRFDRPSVTTLLCNVHPEMQAYIVTVPNRHWDVTDADGRFRIQGVPAGRYALRAWHERGGRARREIELGDGDSTLVRISLPPGEGP